MKRAFEKWNGRDASQSDLEAISELHLTRLRNSILISSRVSATKRRPRKRGAEGCVTTITLMERNGWRVEIPN